MTNMMLKKVKVHKHTKKPKCNIDRVRNFYVTPLVPWTEC